MSTASRLHDDNRFPRIADRAGVARLMVDGKPFLMLAGEIHNSSASSADYLDRHVWDAVTALHCNTVLAPIYWELIEPVEGAFDFALIEALIEGARKRGLRLVLLWFATWKNASSTYAPEWVRTDTTRFPRAQSAPGRNTGALSPFSEEACAADSRALAAVMRHIREIDARRQTVLMVQVQNEAGLLGMSRDRSTVADEVFGQEIPEALQAALARDSDRILPELAAPMRAAGNRSTGTWPQVFGEAADEAFMAWHVARYTNLVARAGREEYPLPMFANAWLVQFDGQRPGEYPSGGPVARMMNIWQWAAPELCLLAPDIYLPDFAGVCAGYTRLGNPLFIPEARRDREAAANVFYAIGRHDALGFAPFGIESLAQIEPATGDAEPRRVRLTPSGAMLAESYRLLQGLSSLISEHSSKKNMIGVLQTAAAGYDEVLGSFQLRIRFPAPIREDAAPGAGLVIALPDNEYILAGHNVDVSFLPVPADGRQVDYLSIEEGIFRDGEWFPCRRLNGDERRACIGARPNVLRIRLYCYS